MTTLFVEMYHPLVPGTVDEPALVASQAVDEWYARGWLLVDPDAPPVAVDTPYYTKGTSDSRFGQLAGDNTWTGANDFSTAPTVAGMPIGGSTTAPDATTSAKGVVQLAGDLGGTAVAPQVTGGTHHTHTASQVSDSTATGRSLLTAADATAARAAIGAGTSSLAIGTTSTTAKAGDYAPPSDAAAATPSMRSLGTSATQAAAGNHTHTATGISDSTTVGRSVLTAADAAAARTAIGAGTSSLAIGTTASTAAAGDDSRIVGASQRALTKRTITAAYTLVVADAVDMVLHTTAASAITITLPQDSAVTIAQEIAIPWRQYAAGQITFAAGTGATLISRGSVFKSAGQNAEGLVTKVAANTWLLSGDISA